MDRFGRWWVEHWREIVPLCSLAVAILSLLLSHFARVRSAFSRIVLRVLGVIGFSGARYKTAFLKEYREIQNIYLNRVEKLDIVSTYVPLRIVDAMTSTSESPAIDVLLRPGEDRLVVLGDPGSGKTTLLKSFGIGLVSSRRRRWRSRAKGGVRSDLIPIYVELRDFAARIEEYPTLAEYIVGYAIPSLTSSVNAKEYFTRSLEKRRCVVLLDALDEVHGEIYDEVRVAILTFLADTTESLPTANARVVMTSRVQNFLAVVTDWIPTGFPRYTVLAPLSNDDIERFLTLRASDLPAGKDVTTLLVEIKRSGTLELHRTPLILTISLGLYIQIPRYTVPDSIGRFYTEIVQELMQRHDFRTRPHLTKRNRFPAEAKLNFLRQFSLTAARRQVRFDEFSYEELMAEFATFRKRQAALKENDGDAFLAEIVDSAGLLRKITNSGTYVFAHRSFMEFFVASQLARNARESLAEIVTRSGDPLWRQIIVFFAAMDHDEHDALVTALAVQAPELAAHCAGVSPSMSEEATTTALSALQKVVERDPSSSALSALTVVARKATGMPRDIALQSIQTALTSASTVSANALFSLSPDDLLDLAVGVASIRSAALAGSCVALSRLAEADARFIAPLWLMFELCMQSREALGARTAGERLLELAVNERGLQTLVNQPELNLSHPPADEIREAFPFTALPRRMNLVLLLLWLERLGAKSNVNGFAAQFRSRTEEPETWAKVEAMLQTRKGLSASVLGLMRLVVWAVLGGSYFVVIAGIIRRGFHDVLSVVGFSSAWTNLAVLLAISTLLAVAVGLVQPLLVNGAMSLSQVSNAANPIPEWVDDHALGLTGSGEYYWDLGTAWFVLELAVIQSPLILAGLLLLPGNSMPLAIVATLLTFWVPASRFFTRLRQNYLRRSNRFAREMLDESSLLWLGIDTDYFA